MPMIAWLRQLIAGPSHEIRESSWAFRTLMQQEADAIAREERKGATVLYARPHPKRTLIGRFHAKLLRRAGSFTRKAGA
jgi:hypothetical protein